MFIPLPEELQPLLAGDRLEERIGVTFLLLTVDGEGWPHVALLSAGELVAAGPGRIRAALWPASGTSANLARAGRCTVAVVHDGAAHYLRCTARRGDDVEPPGGRLAFFELGVQAARRDEADYAQITSGITFRLIEPSSVLQRWHETVRLLQQAPAPSGSG